MSACACTTAFTYGRRGSSNRQYTLLLSGWVLSLATSIFGFCTSWYARRSGFVDAPCLNTYTLPLRWIQASTALYMFLVLSWLFCLTLAIWGSGALYQTLKGVADKTVIVISERHYGMGDLLTEAFFLGELLVLWLTLGLIIFVRQTVKQLFGSAYQVQPSTLSI